MDEHESDRSSKHRRPRSDVNESRSKSPKPTSAVSSSSTPNRSVSSSSSSSSEKKRYATLPSPWGLPTAAVHGVGVVARKVISSNRLTESLWPSKRSSSSSSSVDASSIGSNAKTDHLSNDSISDHTSKTSVNVADEKTAKLPVSTKTYLKGKIVRPIHRHRKTNANVHDHDQSENLKISDGSHVSTTEDSNVIDQLENSKPPDGSDVVNTTGSNVIDELENLKPSDGSHVNTTSSNLIDQPENPKPLDNSHVRPFNQHRWPSAVDTNVIGQSVDSKPADGSHVRLVNQHRWSGTTRYNVTDQSENSKPPDGSHGRLVNQHRWPGTIGSSVLNKNINPSNEATKTCFTPDTGVRKMLPNYANKPIQESSSDATNLLSSSLIPAESQPSSPKNSSYGLASTSVKHSPIVRGVSLTPATREVSLTRPSRGVSLAPATKEVNRTRPSRGVSLTPTTRKVNPAPITREVDQFVTSKEDNITRGFSPFPTTTGASPSPATTEVDLNPTIRTTSPTPPERKVSPTPPAKSTNPPSDNNSLISRLSRSLSTRGVSPSPRPSSPQQSCDSNFTEIDPSPSISTRGGSSHRTRRSSGSRLFFSSNILSMFTKYADRQKENNKEDARRLDLLYNIQVQWQFVNASAEAALDLQRVTAENSLLDMWRTILELWDSVAAKKMDINRLILQLKLYAILYRQMGYIDEWDSIQNEYVPAVSVTTTDLYARTLRLPTTEGVKIDVQALKLAVLSVVQIMQTAASSIESTLSKLDGTHMLASELANIVSHERFLLDECEILLAAAAPLQIKECSLRSQVIQSKHE